MPLPKPTSCGSGWQMGMPHGAGKQRSREPSIAFKEGGGVCSHRCQFFWLSACDDDIMSSHVAGGGANCNCADGGAPCRIFFRLPLGLRGDKGSSPSMVGETMWLQATTGCGVPHEWGFCSSCAAPPLNWFATSAQFTWGVYCSGGVEHVGTTFGVW